MLAMLGDLIAHNGHANAAVLEAIRQNAAATEDTELVDLLHHVLLANRFWLLSVLGLPFVYEDESRRSSSFDSVIKRYRTTHEQQSDWLAAATDADLARTLESDLIPGGRCSVAQAFMQVCMHSHGHRAQCAQLLRRHGGTPPTTDFIAWLAHRPAATWPAALFTDFFTIHRAGSGLLSIVLRPRGGDWLADDIRRIGGAGVHVLVSMLTRDEQIELDLLAEAECCATEGIAYVQVPTPDLGIPADAAPFDRAVKTIVERLARGESAAVHCRQSVGRSGLFSCAVLVALGVPLEKAIATVSEARGVVVPETPEQHAWLEANAVRLRSLSRP